MVGTAHWVGAVGVLTSRLHGHVLVVVPSPSPPCFVPKKIEKITNCPPAISEFHFSNK